MECSPTRERERQSQFQNRADGNSTNLSDRNIYLDVWLNGGVCVHFVVIQYFNVTSLCHPIGLEGKRLKASFPANAEDQKHRLLVMEALCTSEEDSETLRTLEV